MYHVWLVSSVDYAYDMGYRARLILYVRNYAYLDVSGHAYLFTDVTAYLATYVHVVFTSDPRFGLTMMLPPKKWLEKALLKAEQTNIKYTTSPLLFMISGTTEYVIYLYRKECHAT